MSHVARVEVLVQDIDALKAACEALGLTFKGNQKRYAWFGRWVKDYHADDAAYKHGIKPEDYGKCEHAIGVPGSSYEIGLCRDADGKLGLIYDCFGPGGVIAQKLGGQSLPLLKREYAAQVAAKTMRKQGWYVKRTVDVKTGRPKLICLRSKENCHGLPDLRPHDGPRQ